MDNKNHTIDATGLKLGRLATRVATLLMNKNSPEFRKHLVPTVKVTISNASRLDITEKKLGEITHNRYSGYPGGFTSLKGKKIIADKGYGELIKHAVSRMLPKNKLRDIMLKNLIVNE